MEEKPSKKISILIPVFNEEKTIDLILERIFNQTKDWDKEIIAINDGSTDKTLEKLQRFSNKILVISYEKNQGKGAALRTGLEKTTGDIVIFQDADLEYDPKDYPRLVKPILKGETKIVYGSRNLSPRVGGEKKYYWGNLFLTKIVNFLFRTKLNDINTGYKVFERKTLKELGIQTKRFEVFDELTVKTLKKRLKIIEVPISYYPRTFGEGKKLRGIDGLKALLAIIYYLIFSRNIFN